MNGRKRNRGVWFAAAGALCLLGAIPALLSGNPAAAQAQRPEPSEAQRAILKRLGGLRKLSDEERGPATRQLALDIRQLPDPAARLGLANGLANLATEGDFGRETLQEVANTLAEALSVKGVGEGPQRAGAYETLAQLVRYEHVRIGRTSPQLAAALNRLTEDDRQREQADFTLTDLQGTPWTLKALSGKIVLVNFWATWCPPCRKEIPDLEALYTRFKGQGLVVLGISDEEDAKVRPFVSRNAMTYPVLLDPGRKVNTLFNIQGIPRTLIYDRNGKLAAEAIDMRTRSQLLALLARVGLH